MKKLSELSASVVFNIQHFAQIITLATFFLISVFSFELETSKIKTTFKTMLFN